MEADKELIISNVKYNIEDIIAGKKPRTVFGDYSPIILP